MCTLCGHETVQPHRKMPGSGFVSLLLLVPFVLPGVVYQVWRMAMRRPVCPRCGSAALIPGDAPLARTWRAAGWIAGAPAALPPEERFDRIEQAIDAMAVEIDRMHAQGSQLRAGEQGERDLRLRGPTTPH
ncbi:MAG: hypothetical protein ACT4P6_10015 [Gemmatimonadaceae bacterium]